jgi:hypothetical protein
MTPRKLEYINAYVQDMPYVVVQKEAETLKAIWKRVYDTMYILSTAGRTQHEMRVYKQNPATDWKRVWTKIYEARTAETILAVW